MKPMYYSEPQTELLSLLKTLGGMWKRQVLSLIHIWFLLSLVFPAPLYFSAAVRCIVGYGAGRQAAALPYPACGCPGCRPDGPQCCNAPVCFPSLPGVPAGSRCNPQIHHGALLPILPALSSGLPAARPASPAHASLCVPQPAGQRGYPAALV